MSDRESSRKFREFASPHRVMGLDPSFNNFGVVVLDADDGKIVARKTIEVSDPGAMPAHRKTIARAELLRDVVASYIHAHRVAAAGIEDFSYLARSSSVYMLGQLQGIVRATLEHAFGERWIAIAPTQHKKFATGKGNAAKDIYLKEVYKRWDLDFDTSHEAEAFVIAQIARYNFYGGAEALPKWQREILQKIKAKR